MDAYELPLGGLETSFSYESSHAQGVTALVVISCLSLIAVVGLLGAIAISAFNTRKSKDAELFVRTHVAAYFVSLLLCDLIQSLGSIMNARWINEMMVSAGGFCTLQGILKQIADVGTGLWTLVIAIHTFAVLFLGWKIPKSVLVTTMISVWSGIGAVVIAGPATVATSKTGPFFGISGYWCWITPAYPTQRIVLDYMIMFFSAGASFVLYMMVFLRLRGNIIVTGKRLSFRLLNANRTDSWRGREVGDEYMLRIARQMLLYPIAYTILILPIAASRFSVWAGNSVPFGVTTFSASVYLLSGLVNVILFSITKRILPAESVLGALKGIRISRPHLVDSSATLEAGSDAYYRPSSTHAEKEKSAFDFDAKFWNEKSLTPAPMIQRGTSYEFDTASTTSSIYTSSQSVTAPLKLAPSRPTIRTEEHSFLQGEPTIAPPPGIAMPPAALTRSTTTKTSGSGESMYDMYMDRYTVYGPPQATPPQTPLPPTPGDAMFSPVNLMSPQTPNAMGRR